MRRARMRSPVRLPVSRDRVIRVARYAAVFEAVALVTVAVLALGYAATARIPYRGAFVSVAFGLFLVVLFYAVLVGPGYFLSRPRIAAARVEVEARWRQWLTVPPAARDQEFFELLLYVGLAFLLILLATGIDAIVGALGA